MADTDDAHDTEGESTEKQQLEETRDWLEDRGIEESSVDERIDELEGEREQVQELADLKVRVAEAEDAGLGDDPAINHLREQIDALEVETGVRDSEPTAEEQDAERRAELRDQLSTAEATGYGLREARAAALLEPYDDGVLADATARREAIGQIDRELDLWEDSGKNPDYVQKLKDRRDLLKRAGSTRRTFDSVETFADHVARRADEDVEWDSITSGDL